MPRTIEIVDPDPSWAAAFVTEAAALRLVFGDALVGMHHIGSTGVPGLAAKPIVDILVVLHETDSIARFSDAMEGLGYNVRGECLDAEVPGTPGRFYCSKDSAGVRTHHVHVCASSHPQVADLLVLRDYLRSAPARAAAYGSLKHELAQRHCTDNVAYMRGKASFVRTLLEEARAWARSRHRDV